MLTLTVNGQARQVDAESDTPLLWVIREHLQMTGTKFGCGAGLCGACTVHLNGEAVRSCQTAVSQAAGAAKPETSAQIIERLNATRKEIYMLLANE